MAEAVKLNGTESSSAIGLMFTGHSSWFAALLAETRHTTFKYDKANRLEESVGQARTVHSQASHLQSATSFSPVDKIFYDTRGNVTRVEDAARQPNNFLL